MKIPYFKLYPADLLAASRNLTAEQLGDAILGICEQAFENNTAYEPETTHEKRFFELLTRWKEEAKASYKTHHKTAKKAAAERWKKDTFSDGASSIPSWHTTPKCQPETETETETKPETETENNITPIPPTTQGESICSFSEKEKGLSEFARQVIARFEENVQTEAQRKIWFHKNRRKLKDIWEFCGQDIPLALQTISVCARGLAQAGLTGSYSAVCRNLPEYMFRAQQELQEKNV